MDFAQNEIAPSAVERDKMQSFRMKLLRKWASLDLWG